MNVSLESKKEEMKRDGIQKSGGMEGGRADISSCSTISMLMITVTDNNNINTSKQQPHG